jgi:hypothetical protein
MYIFYIILTLPKTYNTKNRPNLKKNKYELILCYISKLNNSKFSNSLYVMQTSSLSEMFLYCKKKKVPLYSTY